MNFKYENHSFEIMRYSSFIALFTIAVLLSSITASNIVFADVIPPNKQLDLNFTPKEVICKQSLVKIIRISDNQPSCVSPDSVDILVKRGFALAPSPEAITDVVEESKQLGKITHMATTKHYKNPGEVETFPIVNVHNYVFKVCAFEERIRSPEIIITSDSESKSFKMPRDVFAEKCNTTAVKVKAVDSNSISAKLLNKGGLTEAITELENKITLLKSEITAKKEKLLQFNAEPASSDRKKKMSANLQQTKDLKMELQNTRVELQKYLLLSSINSASDISPIQKNKSITGVEISGVVYEIISVNEALIQPEEKPENSMAYNAIFEICTDSNSLRIPIVELTSDVGMTTVKMAEKIAKDSCQVSTGKINAISANSIAIQMAGQTQSSEMILELEKKIDSLKDQMKDEQEKLNSVSVSSSISKEERAIAISESTIKIQELRMELNSSKGELHKILLQVYR